MKGKMLNKNSVCFLSRNEYVGRLLARSPKNEMPLRDETRWARKQNITVHRRWKKCVWLGNILQFATENHVVYHS